MDLLPPRDIIPVILLIVSAGGFTFLLLDRIEPPPQLPAWRWGDAPRRLPRVQTADEVDQLIGFGVFCIVLLIAAGLGLFDPV